MLFCILYAYIVRIASVFSQIRAEFCPDLVYINLDFFYTLSNNLKDFNS